MNEGKGVESRMKVEPESLEGKGRGGHELFFKLGEKYEVVLFIKCQRGMRYLRGREPPTHS